MIKEITASQAKARSSGVRELLVGEGVVIAEPETRPGILDKPGGPGWRYYIRAAGLSGSLNYNI
jgi:hypothetical protein